MLKVNVLHFPSKALVPWNFGGREDKSLWPEGVWTHEPDMLKWIDPKTGYTLMIRRGPVGAYCGYVGISKHHRDFQQSDYDSLLAPVHGGLTFGDKMTPFDELWWFGFDCAHLFDYMPMMASYHDKKERGYIWEKSKRSIYRDYAYVVGEIHQLAAFLASRNTFWERLKDLTGHIWAYVFSSLKTR